MKKENTPKPKGMSAETILNYLAEHGGKIVSTASLEPKWIEQARASGRLYVDENSLGYVWEPDINEFPETALKVEPMQNTKERLDKIVSEHKHPMSDDGFIRWWYEQQKVIEKQMEVFDREEKIRAAQAFRDLADVVFTMAEAASQQITTNPTQSEDLAPGSSALSEPVASHSCTSSNAIEQRRYSGFKDSKGRKIYEGDYLDIVATSMYNGLVKVEEGVFLLKTAFFERPLAEYLTAPDLQYVEVSVDTMLNKERNPQASVATDDDSNSTADNQRCPYCDNGLENRGNGDVQDCSHCKGSGENQGTEPLSQRNPTQITEKEIDDESKIRFPNRKSITNRIEFIEGAKWAISRLSASPTMQSEEDMLTGATNSNQEPVVSLTCTDGNTDKQ